MVYVENDDSYSSPRSFKLIELYLFSHKTNQHLSFLFIILTLPLLYVELVLYSVTPFGMVNRNVPVVLATAIDELKEKFMVST
jgi:hypothetical protein